MTPITFDLRNKLSYCEAVGEAVTSFVDNLEECGATAEQRAASLTEALDRFPKWFRAGIPELEYGSPINRAAYLYCYVPALATTATFRL